MIQCKDLCKDFYLSNKRIVHVLKGIDFHVNKGEMVAIKGASGSGKSTLLHILGCLDRPSSGTYSLNGEDTKRLSQGRLAILRNQKIGFVMQHFSLIEDENALKNVEVPLYFSREPQRYIKEKALIQLQNLGIEHLAQTEVCKLSGGEKQRVAIARALIRDPELILADEPTGALDSENTKRIMEIFANLHAQGKTILIVTHEDDVASRCEKTMIIQDGMITEDIYK